MRKSLKVLLVLFMTVSLSACANKSTEKTAEKGKLKAGTYTGESEGMNDKVQVLVEVSEDKILKVEVTSQNETAGIGAPLVDKNGETLTEGGKTPIQLIPEEIVAQQNINVDSVTGATISSAAVKNAVKSALQQAGDVSMFEKDASHQMVEDQESDVVIIGGGGAGLAAGVAAYQNGSNVIILEKNGSVGGDTLVCGAIYNTPDKALQEKEEMNETVKTTIENAWG